MADSREVGLASSWRYIRRSYRIGVGSLWVRDEALFLNKYEDPKSNGLNHTIEKVLSKHIVGRHVCAAWQRLGLTRCPTRFEHDLGPYVDNRNIETLTHASDGLSVSHGVFSRSPHRIAFGKVHHILCPLVHRRISDKNNPCIVSSDYGILDYLDEVGPELR
jgi:hypothetical protein